jgi:hypothetical protein
MTSLETFILFLKLSVELRLKIWREAMLPSRLVMMDEDILLDEDFCSHGDATYSEVGSACWENEREESQYMEDRYGKAVDDEDTRSKEEKDMNMLIHMRAYGVDGLQKEQKQLQQYGFTSS